MLPYAVGSGEAHLRENCGDSDAEKRTPCFRGVASDTALKDEVAAEPPDGAHKRKIKDDAPGGLVEVSELLDLEKDNRSHGSGKSPRSAHLNCSPFTDGCSTRHTPIKPVTMASTRSQGAFSRFLSAITITVSAIKRGAV